MLIARILLAIPLTLVPQSPESEEALREAARRGDITGVESLLRDGVSVNAGNRYGATALFFASDKGYLDIVRLLVRNGADLNIRDTFYQMSATRRALANGHREVVRFLVQNGASEVDEAIRVAARDGDLALLREALVAQRVTPSAHDEALKVAMKNGFAAGVALLKRIGPPPEVSRVTVEIESLDLSRFAGYYQNESLGQILVVEVEVDGLVVRDPQDRYSGRMKLRPSGNSIFEIIDEPQGNISFSGRGGMIERLVIDVDDVSTSYRPMDETESGEQAQGESVDTISPMRIVEKERGKPIPWPEFRGRDRLGIADGQGLVIEWDTSVSKNILWRRQIPGFSASSPIVWGDHVFVLTAVNAGGDDTVRIGLYGDVKPVDDLSEHRWILFALNKSTGEVLWEKELYQGKPLTKRHTKSSQANATPVTDGKRIVNVLGSIGRLVAHDFDGNLLWETDIGVLNSGWFYDPEYQWGHSNSPLIYGEHVILQADIHNGAFISAYNLETGKEAWRTVREDEIPTFSSPTLYRGITGDEIITNGTQIRSYEAATGKPLWFLGPNSEIPIGVPVVADDVIYVTAGYPPIRPIYAIRAGVRGNISLDDGQESSDAIVWSKQRGGTYIPSPIVYRGYFYTNANNGRLTCYDAKTGERIYRARIGGVGGSYAASPIAADNRLYFTSEDGETFVVQAGSKYKLLAQNTVDDVVLSTPAASDGVLIIRSLHHVFGIGEDDSLVD